MASLGSPFFDDAITNDLNANSACSVIHRADYQRILAEEAIRLGAEIRLGCEVVNVDCNASTVTLADGATLKADVVIGADGLHSMVRTNVLGRKLTPSETGDLAYRATITAKHVQSMNNEALNEMLIPNLHKVWWGPESHAVLYGVRGGDIYNLVLAVPDDLPPVVSKTPGNIEQMRKLFEGWDPRLRALIAEVQSSLKWKLVNFKELDTWVHGRTALLGDACHPTLPYQAQGAAMAVEDGACLARLLGLAARTHLNISDVLKLYERLRKDRTTLNVKGATSNRELYHARGLAADERTRLLAGFDWNDPNAESPFKGFNDMPYQRALLGFDTVGNAEKAFYHAFGESKSKM